MNKYVCIEDISILKKDSIYYIDENDAFVNYLQIYDMECKYIGLFNSTHFLELSLLREQRINEILNDI